MSFIDDHYADTVIEETARKEGKRLALKSPTRKKVLICISLEK